VADLFLALILCHNVTPAYTPIVEEAGDGKLTAQEAASKRRASRIADGTKSFPQEESEEVYLKSIKARIKKADIYYNKAVEFIKNKQYQPAEEILEEVVKLNSRDKDAYYNLGVLNEAYLSNKKKALLYYQKFIELAPDSQDAKEVRGWIEEINKQQGVR